MRVLQVNKFLYRLGGSETVLFETTDLLRRHGHEVSFFGMEDKRNVVAAPPGQLASNVDLSEGGKHGITQLSAAARIFYSREAEKKLDALIEAWRPDVAHLHNIYHQLSPSILRALRRRGVPAVMTLHDYKLICPSYNLYSHGGVCERCKGHRYYNAVLQGCVKGSRLNGAICATEAYAHHRSGAYDGIARLIAPSRFMRDKMIEFGQDAARIDYLPNFLDLDAYTPRYTPGRYVAYAGRLERVKGVETLVRALGGSQLEVRIAGDGEMREQLEQQCARQRFDNVRFLGRLESNGLAATLQDAMFVVVPSEWYENAPMSVLEAYAYGKPVIGARIGGIPELIEDGSTGLLFEPGDAAGLRAKVERLLANPALVEEMGRNARPFVERNFGPQQHYERLMAIYARVQKRIPEGSTP